MRWHCPSYAATWQEVSRRCRATGQVWLDTVTVAIEYNNERLKQNAERDAAMARRGIDKLRPRHDHRSTVRRSRRLSCPGPRRGSRGRRRLAAADTGAAMTNDARIVPPHDEELSAHRNRFGFRGVSEPKPGRFRAKVGNDQHAERSRYFSNPVEAAKAYDKMARKRYGKRAYLNFPDDGERHVQAATDGFCKRGHPINETNSYVAPTGRHNCQICNALAQARRKARNRSCVG